MQAFTTPETFNQVGQMQRSVVTGTTKRLGGTSVSARYCSAAAWPSVFQWKSTKEI